MLFVIFCKLYHDMSDALMYSMCDVATAPSASPIITFSWKKTHFYYLPN